MTKLPQFVRSRLAPRERQAVDHPDAALLSAFIEQSLSAHERADVFAHLAQCDTCREIVALSSAAGESDVPDSPIPGRRTWWNLRWPAAALVASLVIAVISHPVIFRNSTPPAPAPVRAPLELQNGISDAMKASRGEARPSAPAKHKAAKKEPAAPPGLVTKRFDLQSTLQQSLPAASPSAPPVVMLSNPMTPLPDSTGTISAPQHRTKTLEARGFVPQVQGNADLVVQSAAQQPGSYGMASQFASKYAERSRGTSLWSLEVQPNALQKSEDGGKTWHSVHVDDHARLDALSSAGTDVWVGGADGALFHSADDGLHWASVIVADETTRLTGTITRIDAIDANSIRLRANPGGYWVTSDGGLHWRRE
ncbi:MAG: zf-HC2 domain-containing protein [Acidobacteriaceae bacterium]|nr:zf-HC2 domain-containing protein [Acidobacteriaceae bacterium]